MCWLTVQDNAGVRHSKRGKYPKTLSVHQVMDFSAGSKLSKLRIYYFVAHVIYMDSYNDHSIVKCRCSQITFDSLCITWVRSDFTLIEGKGTSHTVSPHALLCHSTPLFWMCFCIKCQLQCLSFGLQLRDEMNKPKYIVTTRRRLGIILHLQVLWHWENFIQRIIQYVPSWNLKFTTLV